MEKVYGCGELDYTSEPICLREFFKDATLQPHPFLNGPQGLTELTGKRRENAYMDKMSDVMGSNLTDSEFLELENMCSAKNFTVPGAQLFQVDFDHSLNFFNKIDSPSDSTLKTHQSLKSRPRIPERYLKYSGTVWLDESKSSHEKETKLQNIDLVPGCNIVASLRLYAPFRHQMGARSTSRVASGCQEIMVLGTQSLAELRDSFSCTSDNFLCQDVSSNPFVKTKTYAKSKYKSGMMYIENIFYDDHRCPTNLEYSSTVLKWARENHLSLGRKAKMEDTKVLDLTVKLGYPYLYQHQGNCEHLFCFSDVHLLHQSDCLQSSKYPILKSITRQQSRYCMMCGHYVAKWVTVGNNRVPHDPCYFCQTCFLSYNYINKEKIGTFAAYPYLENSPDLFCLRK